MEEPSIADLSPPQKAETLQSLAAGPLSSSISRLSASSRAFPSGKDFHFYYNFNEFKDPVKQIAQQSEALLKSIGSSSDLLFGRPHPLFFPPDDPADAFDWLVDLNDDLYERIDASMDEFQRIRKSEEGSGSVAVADDGFQLVSGKKKKKGAGRNSDRNGGKDSSFVTKCGANGDEFKILVNNSNEPFAHVWLQRSEDGSRVIHPLEKLSEVDFIDRTVGDAEPIKPLSLETTPFHLVEDVQELKALAAKLRGVNEFAVDLEHNQYRTFQGLTCLMQISTRTEDFVVDTLKLRVHIGPHLREVFKDPSKRKVMHGADRDIIWLQRDFGIYVCNLFDTGQASRVLQMERYSLEHLLHHFCGVTANKEYQNADWRLRPLPDEMIKYAREDTHYLLHIYDLMRGRLINSSAESASGDDLLLEVYKRSCDVCLQLYEKELLTDTSYLYIYGLQGADFDSEQLAIAAGLYGWRDAVAREEDESTGYILPNKTLLEIARQKPVTSGKLRQLVKAKHPFVERNLGPVMNIIRSSIQNAAAFECASEQLKKGRETECPQMVEAIADDSEGQNAPDYPMETTSALVNNISDERNNIIGQRTQCLEVPMNAIVESLDRASGIVEQSDEQFSISSSGEARTLMESTSHSIKAVSVASVQVLKKPSRAFGALLGNPASKRKPCSETKRIASEQEKAEMKVEQIKSSVVLPFHSFSSWTEHSKLFIDESIKHVDVPHPETGIQVIVDSAELSKLEEIIPLENDLDDEAAPEEILNTAEDLKQQEISPQPLGNSDSGGPISKLDMTDNPMSIANLSSGFQDCFKSLNDRRSSKQTETRAKEPESYPELKPYDYATARTLVRFGDGQEKVGTEGEDAPRAASASRVNKKGSVSGAVNKEGQMKESSQAKRRQAFPASGNRSATFR
ncbi:protein RRP6-like protein 2 [Cinnamomum micranthum f. kanehirae]|uniref:Protein RRP6-like protein 2 n=1 Tax=Cinnamomum micranthum f. kanehirae TaxID=337451 RepID=A0A443NUH3_9MAGN|nr:protein RRP6-like protein 2 [Cinnamomum micranthum f. kanehirae]